MTTPEQNRRRIKTARATEENWVPSTAAEHLNPLAHAGFGVVEIFWYSQCKQAPTPR